MNAIASTAALSHAYLPDAGGGPLGGGLRELTAEEIQFVSGAFSFTEMYGSVLAGAVGGALGGAAAGGFVGAASGALIGAAAGGAGYLAYEAWIYCFG